MIVLIIHFYASSFDSILFIIHTDIFTCHYRDSLESEINTAIMWYLNLTALINCGWKIFVRINNTSLHTLSTHTSSFTYQIGFHPAFVILFEQRIITDDIQLLQITLRQRFYHNRGYFFECHTKHICRNNLNMILYFDTMAHHYSLLI